MAFRIYVGDDDLRRLCPELEAELLALADSWPKEQRGRDGVVSNVASDGTYATLTSATGNFKHQRGQGKSVKVGTLVILFGTGFYRVRSVTSNTAVVIEQDGAKASMSFTLAAAQNVQYQVGGFASLIQDVYEDIWNMPGMCPQADFAQYENPLNRPLNADLVDKCLYCPDSWRGADMCLKWGALRNVLYSMQLGENSVYAEKRTLADTEWESRVTGLTFVFFDPPQITEPMGSCSFRR